MVYYEWYIFLLPAEFLSPSNVSSLGEIEFLDVWDDAYAAIMRYTRARDGYWVKN